MNVIHIMKDGTKRKSVEGLVIRNKEFYEVLNAVRKKVTG
jgi:hypothetical protein